MVSNNVSEGTQQVFVPNVLKESSGGYRTIALLDERFATREIQVFGEINDALANSLVMQLQHLSDESPTEQITMIINSPGGSVSSGLEILDVMRMIDCPIKTVCIGQAASMASLLFACGDRREIFEHAQVMIHDPLTLGIAGSALKVQESADKLMKMRETLATILADASGHSVEEIYEKTKQDTYFTAQESIDFGLADEIVLRSKKKGKRE